MAKSQAAVAPREYMKEIFAIPGGEDIQLCIQCGTCSGTCPNAEKMDYAPRQMVALARAGMWQELLSSNSMWYCVSCYLCALRCPRGIHLTDIMYALKQMAIRHGLTKKGGRTSTLARTFVENVGNYGRVWEFGLTTRYYLRLDPWRVFGVLPLALQLLRKGRLPLFPHRIKGRDQLRAILKRAQSMEA